MLILKLIEIFIHVNGNIRKIEHKLMGMYPQDNLYLGCLLSYTTKYELNRSCHILALI